MSKNVYPKYKSQGFKVVLIMVQDAQGNAGSQYAVSQYRQQYNIPQDVTILYDPTGQVNSYGGHSTSWVTNEAGIIVQKGHSDDLGTLESTLQVELQQ